MKTFILVLFGLLALVNAAPQYTAPWQDDLIQPRYFDVQRLEGIAAEPYKRPPPKRYTELIQYMLKYLWMLSEKVHYFSSFTFL